MGKKKQARETLSWLHDDDRYLFLVDLLSSKHRKKVIRRYERIARRAREKHEEYIRQHPVLPYPEIVHPLVALIDSDPPWDKHLPVSATPASGGVFQVAIGPFPLTCTLIAIAVQDSADPPFVIFESAGDLAMSVTKENTLTIPVSFS